MSIKPKGDLRVTSKNRENLSKCSNLSFQFNYSGERVSISADTYENGRKDIDSSSTYAEYLISNLLPCALSPILLKWHVLGKDASRLTEEGSV